MMDLLETPEAEAVFKKFGNPIPLFRPPEGKLDLFNWERGDDGKVDINAFIQHFSQSYGLTGSGKSGGNGRLAEELMLKGVKIFVVDKKGEYSGLAKLSDVEIKIVKMKMETFEDEDAQIEARLKEGQEAADDYLRNKSSIVLDLGGVRAEDYLPYLLGFFKQLWRQRQTEKQDAEKEGRTVVPNKTILEEAKNFIPRESDPNLSKPMKVIALSLISTLKFIATEGRSFGETIHSSSQRPMQLDATFRGQGEVFLFYKQTYPNELEFYLKMMPHDRSERDRLKQEFSEMKPGQCYFVNFGSAYFKRMKRKRTPDLAKTPGYAEVVGWKDGRGKENAIGL